MLRWVRREVAYNARLYDRAVATRWQDAFPNLKRLKIVLHFTDDWCNDRGNIGAHVVQLFRGAEIHVGAEEVLIEVCGVKCSSERPSWDDRYHAPNTECMVEYEEVVSSAVRGLMAQTGGAAAAST